MIFRFGRLKRIVRFLATPLSYSGKELYINLPSIFLLCALIFFFHVLNLGHWYLFFPLSWLKVLHCGYLQSASIFWLLIRLKWNLTSIGGGNWRAVRNWTSWNFLCLSLYSKIRALFSYFYVPIFTPRSSLFLSSIVFLRSLYVLLEVKYEAWTAYFRYSTVAETKHELPSATDVLSFVQSSLHKPKGECDCVFLFVFKTLLKAFLYSTLFIYLSIVAHLIRLWWLDSVLLHFALYMILTSIIEKQNYSLWSNTMAAFGCLWIVLFP